MYYTKPLLTLPSYSKKFHSLKLNHYVSSQSSLVCYKIATLIDTEELYNIYLRHYLRSVHKNNHLRYSCKKYFAVHYITVNVFKACISIFTSSLRFSIHANLNYTKVGISFHPYITKHYIQTLDLPTN